MFGLRRQMKTVDIKMYADQYNELVRKLLKYCCAEADGGNVFISPLSVLILLSIAADSTSGKTRKEILEFLGSDDAGIILSQMQREMVNGRGLTAANAVCVRKDFASRINRSYTDLQLPMYTAKLISSEDMVRDVDEWVNRVTKGLIPKAAPESVKNALLCLINAIAFEADWAMPYEDEDIRDWYFHNADGSASRVWMLCGTEDGFYENDDFTGFVKGYENCGFSFIALLPKKKGEAALTDALNRLDLESLCFSDAIVRTRMPEFKFDYTQELAGMCRSFGICELFTNYADFSPITSDPLKVESILHKAYIDVNQKGTKAGAVTMAVCCAGCAPRERQVREVYLDRPFVFAITHDQSGLPVFVGTVRHLEDAKQDPERLRRRLGRARRLRGNFAL